MKGTVRAVARRPHQFWTRITPFGFVMRHDCLDRRDWLIRASLGAATACGASNSSCLAEALPSDEPSVRLVADPSKTLFRVRIEMDVEGNLTVPNNPLVSKRKAATLPLKSRAVVDYEERVMGLIADRTAQAAERYYHEAVTRGTIGKHQKSLELRDAMRRLNVGRDGSQWLTYSPDGFLTDLEVDLLSLPTSSLAVDALLPMDPIRPDHAFRVGDRFQPDKSVLAAFLSLAAVNDCGVTGEVITIESDQVRVNYQGRVEGSVGGVPTSIDLVGKLVFDRQTMTTQWLAIAINEKREIGTLEPGFEVSATIRMIRKPLAAATRLPAAAALEAAAKVPPERLYRELTSSAVGFAVLMDRRWKMMADAAGASMIRMIEDDRGIAQCDFRPLGSLAAGRQLTMAAMVADVKQSLGDRFAAVLESREEINQAGLRVLRVTAQGAVESIPIQWVFLHFSDDSGRRLLATMTVGGNYLDTFAGADVQLGSSLRLLPLDDETTTVAGLPDTASVN